MCPHRLWVQPASFSNRCRGLIPWGKSGRKIMLATHINQVPRLRIGEDLSPLPHPSLLCGNYARELYLPYRSMKNSLIQSVLHVTQTHEHKGLNIPFIYKTANVCSDNSGRNLPLFIEARNHEILEH
jgi:hypothetical protein